MTKRWRQQQDSGVRFNPRQAVCAFCHRRPVEELIDLARSAVITVRRRYYFSGQAYYDIPVCRKCRRKYRLNQAFSNFTGGLFIMGLVGIFPLLLYARSSGYSAPIDYAPVPYTMLAIAVLGFLNLVHYALVLFSKPNRVKKWIDDPRLRGLF